VLLPSRRRSRGDLVNDAEHGVAEVFRRVDKGLLRVEQERARLPENAPGDSLDQLQRELDQLQREGEQLEAAREHFGSVARLLSRQRGTLRERQERLAIYSEALRRRELSLRNDPKAVDGSFKVPFLVDTLENVADLRGFVQEQEVSYKALVNTYREEFEPYEQLLADWGEALESQLLAIGKDLLDSRREIPEGDSSADRANVRDSMRSGSEELPDEGSGSALSSDDVQEPLPPPELLGQVLEPILGSQMSPQRVADGRFSDAQEPLPPPQRLSIGQVLESRPWSQVHPHQPVADGVTVDHTSAQRDVRRAQVLEDLQRAAERASSERSGSDQGRDFL
jgi:hypothetical protein